MSENDYRAGYRGEQFHHGMDRAEYERGKSQKETEDILSGSNKKVPIDGVSFTILLVAPFIWMVYPVLGITMYAVVGGLVFLSFILPFHPAVELFVALFPAVMSFFWGYQLEYNVGQNTVYRWFRGALRIVLPLVAVIAFSMKSDTHSVLRANNYLFNKIAGAVVLGLLAGLMVYLIFQQLDVIYFRNKKEFRKFQDQLAKGERPKRSMAKRLLYGATWFVPVMVVLSLISEVILRMFMDQASQRSVFIKQYGPYIGGMNVLIWYLLCFFGKLPGTSKFRFSKRHEEDVRQLQDE